MPTWAWILSVCGGFLCIVSTLREVQKIVHDFKAPHEDVEEKLDRDYQRLNRLDKEMKEIKEFMTYIKESQNLLLENDMTLCEHMRTDNATGKIAKIEQDIKKFLIKHQQGEKEDVL